MTVDIERTYRVEATIDEVWALLEDPATRATAISVVDHFDREGSVTIWHLRLPIPVIRRTVSVRTWDVERDPPRYVRFVGESRIMDVQGEHELSWDDGTTVVRNRFVVDGKLPGVERFFKQHLDDELTRIRRYVQARVGDARPD